MTKEHLYSDYVRKIFDGSSRAAVAAKQKYPQPNYITLKVAEESGEVVRAAVHYIEGRCEWQELEDEVIQTIAMLLRLLTEGDEVNGLIPPVKRELEP